MCMFKLLKCHSNLYLQNGFSESHIDTYYSFFCQTTSWSRFLKSLEYMKRTRLTSRYGRSERSYWQQTTIVTMDKELWEYPHEWTDSMYFTSPQNFFVKFESYWYINSIFTCIWQARGPRDIVWTKMFTHDMGITWHCVALTQNLFSACHLSMVNISTSSLNFNLESI